MKLIFKYDPDKDIENFLKSSTAINSKKPTKLQRLYMEKYRTDPEPQNAGIFIVEYLKISGIDISQQLGEIERGWRAIEPEVLSRMERMLGVPYPHETITVYLSTNSRCTYNIESGYFYVHLESPHTNGIIAHELLHFYTWYAYHDVLERAGTSKQRYNDIKESLTELLNLEFTDLLSGYQDAGYPQHADLRQRIRESWNASKDMKGLINALIEREEITQIIEADNGQNWWVPERFEENIRAKLPTTLNIVAPPPHHVKNYNCFVFMLGLHNDPAFLGGNNPIQQEFVKWLIRKGVLVPVEQPTIGDIVLYENEFRDMTHSGTMQSADNVLSKWMWGPTIAHKLWDVPSSFGDRAMFFRPIPAAEAKKEYELYKATGVIIHPIL